MVIAMSGGVDSSVAASLLVSQGFEVIGLALKLLSDRADDPNNPGACCSPDDLYDARRVADAVEMPFYVSNATRLFDHHVMDAFTRDYLAGRTPNPCVHCNDKVKFARLFQLAEGLGARYLATGHYARITRDEAGYHLHQGRDAAKDQSYFLFNLGQPELSRLLFPLGEMKKEAVRRYADERDLPTASKHESMEICFVGRGSYVDFVASRAGGGLPQPGPLVHLDGRVLGRHRGIHHYTIGQRRGLGLPGGHGPLYVVAIDGERLIVGPNEALLQRGLLAHDLRWVAGRPPAEGRQMEARIRHQGHLVPARIVAQGDGAYAFELLSPHRAISPGQAVVLYDGAEVLGGGRITCAWVPGTPIPWERAAGPGTLERGARDAL